MVGQIDRGFLRDLESRRAQVKALTERMLLECRAQGRETLNEGEAARFAQAKADLAGLDERCEEIRSELDREGTIPERLRRLSQPGRGVNSAGRLSPLACPDEELRRLFDHAQRGEQASYEKRFTSADSLLPPELFPYPIGQIHENRLLNKLPGYATELPQIEFIRHTSTTGSAESVAEGALKPEVTLVVDKLVVTVAKLAAHLALSREILDDWDAFSQYSTQELFKIVIDCENAQLLNAAGAGTDMQGFYATPGILTHDVAADTGTGETVWDSLEKSIAELRSGSALAEPNLIVMHPDDWSTTRRVKDSFERYLVSADPSTDQVNTCWGIDVLTTVQNPLGKALLIDTSKFGQVAIRSPLGLRLGFSNDDFSRNLVRYVGETRLALTVTRPAAVLEVKNLPAPTTTATKAAAKK